MSILPVNPTLCAGQSLQFGATTPWGNAALWSVLPDSAGVITSAGLFTAATTPGHYSVYAVWSEDVRYTASTTVTIVAPPSPAVIMTNLVQAFGAEQTVPGTAIFNGAIAGETVEVMNSGDANQAIKMRYGFDPPND